MLLHGYGSNENDLFSFQRLFPKNHTIVSFRAPLKVFEGMYAWYEIYFENNVKSFNQFVWMKVTNVTSSTRGLPSEVYVPAYWKR